MASGEGGFAGGIPANSTPEDSAPFQWTASLVLKVLFLFAMAGLAEIGGGWLVWQAVREGKPWWWAVLGGFVLVAYGALRAMARSCVR